MFTKWFTKTLGRLVSPSRSPREWLQQSRSQEMPLQFPPEEAEDAAGSGLRPRVNWLECATPFLTGTALKGIEILDDLCLAKLRFRSLPEDVTVRGDLDLRQCQRLRQIGDGLVVQGDLSIGGRCSETLWWEGFYSAEEVGGLSRDGQTPIRVLPEGLDVHGSLRLRTCHQLETLPNRMLLGGDLVIEGCQRFRLLPDPCRIQGNLTLKGCPNLCGLPSTIDVAGDVRLVGLPIKHLPKELRVGGSLTLEDCPRLESLPSNLHVGQDFVLRRCPVASLSDGLHVGRHLIVHRCAKFTDLCSDTFVGKDIRVDRCDTLTAIPDGLKCRGGLKVTRCRNLRDLPDGLRIPGALNLEGCSGLAAIPDDARIGCQGQRHSYQPALVIADCTSLKSLPANLNVEGPIDVAGSGLTDLPKSLSSCRIMWRGLAVRPDVVFHPERLTAAEILTERNVELRRVMLERVGCERLFTAAKARIHDEDTDAGGRRRLVEIVLMQRDQPRPHRYLHCRCPSTAREYLLRVPPTVESCHEAAAWLAGFNDPKDYQPIQET